LSATTEQNYLEIIKYFRFLQAINPDPKPRAKPWKIKVLQLDLTSQKNQLLSHSDYTVHVLQLLNDVLQQF